MSCVFGRINGKDGTAGEKLLSLFKTCDLSLSRCQNKSKSNFPPSMINIMSQPLGNNQRAKITLITTRQIDVGQGQGRGFSDGHGHILHPGDFFLESYGP